MPNTPTRLCCNVLGVRVERIPTALHPERDVAILSCRQPSEGAEVFELLFPLEQAEELASHIPRLAHRHRNLLSPASKPPIIIEPAVFKQHSVEHDADADDQDDPTI